MTAFVSFVRAYAIWIYLLLLFGILFGAKVLMDARRLSRTTLFSLDQERAVEQSFRAIVFTIVLLIAMVVVTGINLFIAPLAPTPEPAILRGPTTTLIAVVFPTQTPVPTVTPTFPPPAETVFYTATPVVATPTRPKATSTPVLTAVPTSPFPLPAPTIVGPLPNGGTWIGEGQANAAITFRWVCDQCNLGANDWYEVVITYVDRFGAPKVIAGRTQDKTLSLRRIIEGGGLEVYQQAKEDKFQWFVQIKREPGNQPISPPSETWKFVWK